MRRLFTAGFLVLAVAACSSGGSTPLSGNGGNGGGGVLPGVTLPADLGGDSSPGTLGDLGAADPAGLTKLPSEKVCSLLTTSEAASLLGTQIDGTPSGMLANGLGTNCLYNGVADANGNSPLIKIEFNTLGYTASNAFLKLSNPQALTVAGRPAMGTQAPADPNAFAKAQLDVSLSDNPNAVCLYVEAPTLDIAKKVAETVLPRIATLK